MTNYEIAIQTSKKFDEMCERVDKRTRKFNALWKTLTEQEQQDFWDNLLGEIDEVAFQPLRNAGLRIPPI